MFTVGFKTWEVGVHRTELSKDPMATNTDGTLHLPSPIVVVVCNHHRTPTRTHPELGHADFRKSFPSCAVLPLPCGMGWMDTSPTNIWTVPCGMRVLNSIAPPPGLACTSRPFVLSVRCCTCNGIKTHTHAGPLRFQCLHGLCI